MPGNSTNGPPEPAAAAAPMPCSELLNAIYAATLQADCWPRILAALGPAIGTAKAMFTQVDRVVPSDSVTHVNGLAPEHVLAIKNRDLDQDYIWHAALQLPSGTVYRSTELHPTDVLHAGPLYEQIAVPAGLDYVLGAILENSTAFFSIIGFMQSGGDFTDGQKGALRPLVPHLQLALQIHRRIAVGDAGRREALLSFDRARQAVVVLDRSGYAVYSNQSATRFLQAAEGMSLKFGRFLFDDIAAQSEFERVVRLALAAENADIPPVPREVRIGRKSGGPPYGLSIIPVHRSSDRALLPDGAGCMVLIHDLAGLNPLPVERLSWLYGLTPAESRICESLYRVGSVDAAAEDLCLTRNTVRSHLKSIYSKFGVVTQGQLMQRLGNSVRMTDIVTETARN